MAVWVVARHILYIAVCYSIYKDIPIEIDYGCYRGKKGELVGPFEPTSWSDYLEPFQDPEGTVCFTNSIKWGFLSCLLFLQVLTLMWFVMICRVAVKVLKGGKADDTRSDDEEDEEEEIEEIQTNGQMHGMEYAPIEEEVGAEALGLKGRTASTKRYKKSSSSSGVSLPGHSDRKELLGRIGCDKGV